MQQSLSRMNVCRALDALIGSNEWQLTAYESDTSFCIVQFGERKINKSDVSSKNLSRRNCVDLIDSKVLDSERGDNGSRS